MLRLIENVLISRKDVSPFLVHLTRPAKNQNADDALKTILNEKILKKGSFVGGYPISDRYWLFFQR